MEKFLKIEFIQKEIKITVNQLTEGDIFKAITCLLESLTKESYSAIRKAITDAENKYKENKND